MDVIELLEEDHRYIEELLALLRIAGDSDLRRRLRAEIAFQLRQHAEAEEEIIYPELEHHLPDLVEQDRLDHAEFDDALAEVERLELRDDRLVSRLIALHDRFEEHTAEEEADDGLLGRAARLLSDLRRARMAEQLLGRRTSTDLAA